MSHVCWDIYIYIHTGIQLTLAPVGPKGHDRLLSTFKLARTLFLRRTELGKPDILILSA